jgi:hypothetical protein
MKNANARKISTKIIVNASRNSESQIWLLFFSSSRTFESYGRDICSHDMLRRDAVTCKGWCGYKDRKNFDRFVNMSALPTAEQRGGTESPKFMIDRTRNVAGRLIRQCYYVDKLLVK